MPTLEDYIKQLLTVPGTNTNSNYTVRQAVQLPRKEVKVKQLARKASADRSWRNILKRRKTGKTADDEARERAIREATQPTWRSDVADALHTVGNLSTGAAAIGGLVMAPIPTALAIAGGAAGGAAVDKAVDYFTDSSSWAQWLNRRLGLRDNSMIGLFTNPGMIVGGTIGAKAAPIISNLYRPLHSTSKTFIHPSEAASTGSYVSPSIKYIDVTTQKPLMESNSILPEGYTIFKKNQVLNTRNGQRTVTLVKDNNGKVKILEDIMKPPFKSELNWSYKSWFEDAAGRLYKKGPRSYNDQDIADLESHIPEYLQIEKEAKENGTWLHMPDGSIWPGDPRSWVLYKSKAALAHNPEVFWTGIRNSEKNPNPNKEIKANYLELLWGTYGQGKLSAAKARTYAEDDAHVLPMFTKKDLPTVEVDAKGLVWHSIDGTSTDKIVDNNYKGNKRLVKIKNVSDTGPEKVTPGNSKYSYGDFMTDHEIINDARVPQNDIILYPRTFRKSLVGGNGNFKHPTNMYRTILFPLGISWGLYNYSK